jgi:hypothetical protein
MARRPATLRVNCAKEGCREAAHFEHDSMRERDESARWYAKNKWLCYRHSAEDEVLSAANTVRVATLTVARSRNTRYERDLAAYEAAVARGSMFAYKPREFYDHKLWVEADNGIVSGPGFKAFADDFPEGARLVVSVRLEMPDCGHEFHGADGGACPGCGWVSHPIPSVPTTPMPTPPWETAGVPLSHPQA